MLDAVIQDLIRKQRPYYIPQGNPIKGLDNTYWLIFKHRDADNLRRNIVTLQGFGENHDSHKLLRINLRTAQVAEYTPRKPGDVPSTTLLRTSPLRVIEKFLNKQGTTKEKALLKDSFLELKSPRRRYSLPDELDKYNALISESLKRTQTYRRSTAYFDSGVLKLYEEPLQHIVEAEGLIRLLMDWQGFTKRRDVEQLQKLEDPAYRAEYVHRTLAEFLQGLEDRAFTGTEILAELVRLGFLQIKLVKMDSGRSIYHKKTGILSDHNGNHIFHEGSDNFTRAAHSRNGESVTFFYSWDSRRDAETIDESIKQFDWEWQREDITFDLSQEFLQQVLIERDRRIRQKQPKIDAIIPDEFPAGETTPVEITGHNLDQVEAIEVSDNDLVTITIDSKEPERIQGQVEVDPNHPSRPLGELKLKIKEGEHRTKPQIPIQVSQSLTIPEFSEIEGFKQAVELIVQGKHGTPEDFLYWLAQQRPRQFRVAQSDQLDKLLDQDVLFEHQKSGAQHCVRVMQDFGMAVCADAVGLGKTRLAAAVARLFRQQNGQVKVAIIAAEKLFPNWEREMAEVGLRLNVHYELFNKNLMSRKGNNFLTNFNRYGGPDLVIIDEAHEGIRNYKSRIHKTCLEIKERYQKEGRPRQFLLLTATPWNNRREDIYNILFPFLTRPEGFDELGFPSAVAQWFQNRETGKEPFTDDTELFRRIYRELFLQRTRQMLRDATPELALYAKRIAEWLPVEFEADTEQALEQIFTQFEDSLFIPFADPIRYLTGSVEQGGLLKNQRRFFLQRAESSMYALRRTIKNFGDTIRRVQQRLSDVTPDADGLKDFLLLHYKFESPKKDESSDWPDLDDREVWDEDDEDDEEEEADDETKPEQLQKRQQLSRSIDIATNALRDNPGEAKRIYNRILADCESDLAQLEQIQRLLADEFVKDHKREQVTQKVRELVSQGHKVLLISTFADTVIDYYRYMASDPAIANKGIGMAIGSTKQYYPAGSNQGVKISPNTICRGTHQHTGQKRQQLFRLFAPVATCKKPVERPRAEEELKVLIGSETLSVGQNLQDADYLINIDLPWNPMILEQRIGRIDRPKQHRAENIYIYYANSESQLLRQASRLSNLHKKLIGDLANKDGKIPTISSVNTLGASIYGDTLFDDKVLPGYIDFLKSLVKARRAEQVNLQEDTYRKQETYRDLYTQNEILHSQELTQLLEKLGEDYQANPITLGRSGGKDEPTGLVALRVDYFGPNSERIPSQQQTLYWNDSTGKRDGYGVAIVTGFKTPEAGDVFSTKHLLSVAQKLYKSLVTLKQQLSAELDLPDTLENISITSERISKIQRRVSSLDSFPAGLDRAMVKSTFQTLNTWKNNKGVQKLLRNYTDGAKSKLDDATFVSELVEDTNALNLIASEGVKPTSLKVSLAAILLRAW